MLKVKNEADAEKQKELYNKLFETDLPTDLAVFEKRIQTTGSKGHIEGDKWTIADFAFAGVFFASFYNEGNPNSAKLQEALAAFPNLKAYAESLQTELKEYLANRPQPRPFWSILKLCINFNISSLKP